MPRIESGETLNTFIRATGDLVEDAIGRLSAERRRRIETLIEAHAGKIEFFFTTDPFHLTCTLRPAEDMAHSAVVLFNITASREPDAPNTEARARLQAASN